MSTVLGICPELEVFPALRLYPLMVRSQAQGGCGLGAEMGATQVSLIWILEPCRGFPGEENLREHVKFD